MTSLMMELFKIMKTSTVKWRWPRWRCWDIFSTVSMMSLHKNYLCWKSPTSTQCSSMNSSHLILFKGILKNQISNKEINKNKTKMFWLLLAFPSFCLDPHSIPIFKKSWKYDKTHTHTRIFNNKPGDDILRKQIHTINVAKARMLVIIHEIKKINYMKNILKRNEQNLITRVSFTW